MMKDIVFIWILIQFLVNVKCSQRDTCLKEIENARWRLIYENDIYGKRVFGSKSELIMAALYGAHIRVGFTDVLDVFDEVRNVQVHSKNDVISAELSFDLLSQWVFVIVDTNGNYFKQIYRLGRTFLSEKDNKTGVKWFVKKTNCGSPTYFHAKRTLGSLSALRDSIKKGFTISIVSKENDVTSVSLLDNVYISSNKIYGQQVNDVLSKKLDRNRIVYESNISRVFTMFSTDNTIERSNWDLTVHRSRDYSKEYGALSWFADTRWKLVYAHSKTGMPLKGSINDLRSAILTGRRIRFQLPDSTFFTTEADYLVIKNGHVTTRILRVATSNTSDGFDRKGLWEWLMVSTTGTVKTARYQVGDENHKGFTFSRQQIKWFVDTTRWNLAFEIDSFGNVINGKKESLIKKIRAGATIRCVMRDWDSAFTLPSLILTKNGEVEASPKSYTEINYMSSDRRELKFIPNTIWWHEIIDTTAKRVISVCQGRSIFCSLSKRRNGFKWFTNE